tara:strand:- start:970 stop:1194 length:225 start_codon:yes stop_codon:yes gene_type:complete
MLSLKNTRKYAYMFVALLFMVSTVLSFVFAFDDTMLKKISKPETKENVKTTLVILGCVFIVLFFILSYTIYKKK